LWLEVANAMPGRNARQCRKQWNHYFSRKSSTPWTPNDDRLLVHLVETYGQK
jgi:hypothetical protein